jgi:hypothetical protein
MKVESDAAPDQEFEINELGESAFDPLKPTFLVKINHDDLLNGVPPRYAKDGPMNERAQGSCSGKGQNKHADNSWQVHSCNSAVALGKWMSGDYGEWTDGKLSTADGLGGGARDLGQVMVHEGPGENKRSAIPFKISF